MNEIIYTQEQWVKHPISEVFEFFKDAKNLEEITPQYLNFKIVGMNTKEVQKDSIIDYNLKLHGIPFSWKTKISEFVENEMFIDEQMKGPYKKWVHTHLFIEQNGGTLIKDSVSYIIPLGIIGKSLLGKFIRSDIDKIFNYRKQVISKRFGDASDE